MNEARKKWLQVYIESGDAHKATKTAYPHLEGQSVYSKTGYLKNELADEIDKTSRESYGKEAPLMQSIIKDLALHAKQDAVKLKAADTWLQRAQHDAPMQVELKETATHEQLLERLKIATTGIDPNLLAGVLPPELTSLLTKETKEDEQRH